MLVPVREFTTASELRSHYAGLLARMRPPTPRSPREVIRHVDPVPEPEAKIDPLLVEFVAPIADCSDEPVEPASPVITIRVIFRTVARHFDISYQQIIGPECIKKFVIPRHAAMYLARKLSRHSIKFIGRQCGGRDHTTVLNAVERAESLMAADETFRAKVDEIEAEITGGAIDV